MSDIFVLTRENARCVPRERKGEKQQSADCATHHVDAEGTHLVQIAILRQPIQAGCLDSHTSWRQKTPRRY
jgi:hypothetical protein